MRIAIVKRESQDIIAIGRLMHLMEMTTISVTSIILTSNSANSLVQWKAFKNSFHCTGEPFHYTHHFLRDHNGGNAFYNHVMFIYSQCFCSQKGIVQRTAASSATESWSSQELMLVCSEWLYEVLKYCSA